MGYVRKSWMGDEIIKKILIHKLDEYRRRVKGRECWYEPPSQLRSSKESILPQDWTLAAHR